MSLPERYQKAVDLFETADSYLDLGQKATFDMIGAMYEHIRPQNWDGMRFPSVEKAIDSIEGVERYGITGTKSLKV